MDEQSSGRCCYCNCVFGFSESDIFVFNFGEVHQFTHSQCGQPFAQKNHTRCIEKVQASGGMARISQVLKKDLYGQVQVRKVVVDEQIQRDRNRNQPRKEIYRQQVSVPNLGQA